MSTIKKEPKNGVQETNKEAARPQEEVKSRVRVEPVRGEMHHLLLDKPIRGITEFEGMDSWLVAQIQAGKLRVV